MGESPKQEIQAKNASTDANKSAGVETNAVAQGETNAVAQGVSQTAAAPVKNAGKEAGAKGAAVGNNPTASIKKDTPTPTKAKNGGGTLAGSAETAKGEKSQSNVASPSPTVHVKESPSPSNQGSPPPASSEPA